MEPLTVYDAVHYELFRHVYQGESAKLMRYVIKLLINKACYDPIFGNLFEYLPELIYKSYIQSQKCTFPQINIEITEGDWSSEEVDYLLDILSENIQTKCCCQRRLKNSKDYFYVFSYVFKKKTKNKYLHNIINDFINKFIS